MGIQMIKSVSSDQSEILAGIMDVCGIERFCCDITYGNGAFYKNIPEPRLKFDIDPQKPGVVAASSESLPIADQSLNTVVYDPPFLTYVRRGREHGSIMSRRFGGYWRYDELASNYRSSIRECHRVLRPGGILVFKCQDIIHNHKMHPTHINIVIWSCGMFELKDLYVLFKGHRIPIPEKAGERRRVQKHARIHHSYFLVMKRCPTEGNPGDQ